jgi:hypothetical protein
MKYSEACARYESMRQGRCSVSLVAHPELPGEYIVADARTHAGECSPIRRCDQNEHDRRGQVGEGVGRHRGSRYLGAGVRWARWAEMPRAKLCTCAQCEDGKDITGCDV